MNISEVIVFLEDFVTHPDNEFITDEERNAFYVLANALNKFEKAYG